ncbi:MAG: SMC-Scp complex subunit ScpB [Omnitrophica bacterium RIFCSPHIGHO2_02_FULL_46_11]|nr:MAG: SMC-Scp complex subunit ScpB [Omnitrophica bacterium RIFCSPHIGHO2_02_FULL_46_11]OGW87262.1 MAG: SMC-Scp complex subunit ScpB [Omnitrophica bacterium RIFCSPLOWO2_01_FULL_45_10b]
MPKLSDEQKEKEKQAQLKALRQELEREISDQLPAIIKEERRSTAKIEAYQVRNDEEAKRIIEAVLFTSGKPVTLADLKRALGSYSQAKIEPLIRELQSEYERDGRSFRIQEIAGGFECATAPKFAPWILKLELQKKSRQATQSALETLAILAYKQPTTRAEIEDLRGVDVSGVLVTLIERGLIKIVGRKEVPGRPFLYGTTDKFLEHFGLKSITNLPDISEIKSLIENSVKREELLRTEKIISVEEEAKKDEAKENKEHEP